MYKTKALLLATLVSILPAIVAGAIVGLFFIKSFWYWTAGIASPALFFICLDRVPVRLFAGAMRGLPLWPLLKYGFVCTDKISSNYNSDEEWRYWFLYNSDHHKR